jgi:hypothetical protein
MVKIADDIAKQIIYHATFGTFKKDIGILSASPIKPKGRKGMRTRNDISSSS